MSAWTIAEDGTIEARHAGRIGALSADVSAEHRALIAAAPALLAALNAALDQVDIDYVEGYEEPEWAQAARYAVEAANGCEPWTDEPLPALYDDDEPTDEPPPLPSESDRAGRAWEAGRLG